MTVRNLRALLQPIRKSLNKVFAADTCVGPFNAQCPAGGHCAAVAVLVRQVLGGTMLSTTAEEGEYSHWYNRVEYAGVLYDVDLTGDQFGHLPIRVVLAGSMYPWHTVRERSLDEVDDDTLRRAFLLAWRSR